MPPYYYSEKSVWLPDSFWCYSPGMASPAVNPLPAVAAGHVTFGCLNVFAKVSADVLAAWCRLLRQVPRSRLMLHAKEGSHRQRVFDLVQREGIDPTRLSFTSRLPGEQYFQLYQQIDIGLDTFPCAGGTTTCDATWMGVPVVTLAGRTAVGRSGVSILSNVGLPELIAQSQDKYVRLAAELAGDIPRLAAIRGELRSRMQQSPLMNAPRFARNIEAAFRQMWQQWCSK